MFVTVGTQGAFDRLIAAADDVAGRLALPATYQINAGSYAPTTGPATRSMSAADFQRTIKDASIVVAHAGMGSILTALEFAKPVIVMPRRASLGEHRNEHQTDTARTLEALGMVQVCWEVEDLFDLVERANATQGAGRPKRSGNDQSLRTFVADFVRRSLPNTPS